MIKCIQKGNRKTFFYLCSATKQLPELGSDKSLIPSATLHLQN